MSTKFNIGDKVTTWHPKYKECYSIYKIDKSTVIELVTDVEELVAFLKDKSGESIGEWSFDNLILVSKNQELLFEDFYDKNV